MADTQHHNFSAPVPLSVSFFCFLLCLVEARAGEGAATSSFLLLWWFAGGAELFWLAGGEDWTRVSLPTHRHTILIKQGKQIKL